MTAEQVRLGGAGALGVVVRHLRRSRGLTQAELAAYAEMSPNAIGAIERGDFKNPSLLGVSRIALALGVGPGVLAAAFVQPVGDVSLPLLLGHGAHVGPQKTENSRGDRGGRPSALGAALRDLRARAGLTQASLARAAELGRGYISDLEQGKTKDPGLLTITQLAVGLATEISDYDVVTGVVVRLTCAFTGEPATDLGMPGQGAPA